MPRAKLNKTKLTLYIDKNVLARAKELIPNLSEFVEMKLKEYVILAEHGLANAGGGIRTHDPRGERLSRPPPYHSATPAQLYLV